MTKWNSFNFYASWFVGSAVTLIFLALGVAIFGADAPWSTAIACIVNIAMWALSLTAGYAHAVNRFKKRGSPTRFPGDPQTPERSGRGITSNRCGPACVTAAVAHQKGVARYLPRVGGPRHVRKERRLGIWAECVPHDRREELYEALRKHGVQCEVGPPDPVASDVEVLCSDGGATVHLHIRPTGVTLVSTKVRASVPNAYVVQLGPAPDRTWRQRRLDKQLFARIKAVLVPFVQAEREIEKAALLAKASNPAEANELLREWNKRHRKR